VGGPEDDPDRLRVRIRLGVNTVGLEMKRVATERRESDRSGKDLLQLSIRLRVRDDALREDDDRSDRAGSGEGPDPRLQQKVWLQVSDYPGRPPKGSSCGQSPPGRNPPDNSRST